MAEALEQLDIAAETYDSRMIGQLDLLQETLRRFRRISADQIDVPLQSDGAVLGEAQMLDEMERGQASSEGAVPGEAQVLEEMERGKASSQGHVPSEAPAEQRVYGLINAQLHEFEFARVT